MWAAAVDEESDGMVTMTTTLFHLEDMTEEEASGKGEGVAIGPMGDRLSTTLTPTSQDPACVDAVCFRLCQVSNAVAPRWTWLIATWLLEEF